MATNLSSGSPDSPAVRSPGPDRAVAVTSADGALVTIGAQGDSAATSSVIGLLKAIKTAVQGAVSVALSGGTTLTAAQVVVDTTAGGTLILARNPNRRGAIIKLSSTATAMVYLGPSGVATNTGHVLEPGESIQLDTAAAVYGTLATGTQTVSYLEQSA